MHAWEREGAAVTHIARKFLKMAVMRYVDDLFAPERCVQMCVTLLHVVAQCVCCIRRKATMEHALQCLARLIRVLLGPTAVAEKKLACGAHLDVLGVDIKMSRRGYTCRPRQQKVQKWLKTMETALAKNRLCPGVASKLAGKLSWGTSQLFRLLHLLRSLMVRGCAFVFAGNSVEPCCARFMIKRHGEMVACRVSCAEPSHGGYKS